MKKKLAAVLLAAVIVVAAAGAVFFLRGYFQTKSVSEYFQELQVSNETVINVSALREQILSIGELATLEYDYTNVINSKTSSETKGWSIPGTKKSFIAMFDGTMKLGIDLSDISVDANEDTQSIIIIIPKAKILSHEIHMDTFETLNEKTGLFSRYHIGEDIEQLKLEQQALEDKVNDASKSDMLTRAENDAVKMLQTLIAGIVPAEYTVEVTVAAAP